MLISATVRTATGPDAPISRAITAIAGMIAPFSIPNTSAVSKAATAIFVDERSVNFESWDHVEEEEGAREALKTGDIDCSLLASKGVSQARFTWRSDQT